eukprot:6904841-Prymnesium_polylepis.1
MMKVMNDAGRKVRGARPLESRHWRERRQPRERRQKRVAAERRQSVRAREETEACGTREKTKRESARGERSVWQPREDKAWREGAPETRRTAVVALERKAWRSTISTISTISRAGAAPPAVPRSGTPTLAPCLCRRRRLCLRATRRRWTSLCSTTRASSHVSSRAPPPNPTP